MTVIRSRQDLERMQADGEISTGDADEVVRFMDFLDDVTSRRAPVHQVYADHYPEHQPTTEKETPMTEPTPETEPIEELPPITPDEYAAGVLHERIRTLADQSGLLLGEGQGYVDSRFWAAAITDRLVAHGWSPPEDVPEREPGDVYRDGFPLEVTALKDMAVAYNSLMWRLAVAMGLAEEGDGIVDLDLQAVADHAVSVVTDTYAEGQASTQADPA